MSHGTPMSLLSVGLWPRACSLFPPISPYIHTHFTTSFGREAHTRNYVLLAFAGCRQNLCRFGYNEPVAGRWSFELGDWLV